MGKKSAKSKEKSSLLDRLSLFVTLIVVALFAIFIGFLIGEYAISWVASPKTETASKTFKETTAETIAETMPPQKAPEPVTRPSVSTSSGSSSSSSSSSGSTGPNRATDTPAVTGTSASPALTPPGEASRQTIVRVHVGRYSTRDEANATAERLKKGTPPIEDAWVLFDQQTGEYRVQVGAFSNAARATDLARELQEQNFDAFVVP